MRHSTLIPVILAMTATLSACGGGGGNAPTTMSPGSGTTPEQPPATQKPTDSGNAPSATHRPTLQSIPAPVTLADVQRYVQEGINNPIRGADPSHLQSELHRWTAPPRIRISMDTPPAQRRTIARAIHGINAHLPTNWHLTIGPDMPRVQVGPKLAVYTSSLVFGQTVN